jgi:hypothetical protein
MAARVRRAQSDFYLTTPPSQASYPRQNSAGENKIKPLELWTVNILEKIPHVQMLLSFRVATKFLTLNLT